MDEFTMKKTIETLDEIFAEKSKEYVETGSSILSSIKILTYTLTLAVILGTSTGLYYAFA